MAKKRRRSAEDTKRALRAKSVVPKLTSRDFLSTGSTVLDLACGGTIAGGFPKGSYVYFVGDTNSGKTFCTLTCMAEAGLNKTFRNHRLIYDGGEFGALMDLKKFFGEHVANNLEPPRWNSDGTPQHSATIQDLYFNVADHLDRGPCIYVLDSMDVLSSEEEGKKFEQKRQARGTKAAKDIKGDYGDGKPKESSRRIRTLLNKLMKTGSIFIIINQTRDNVGGGPFDPKKTHSGGHALSFYATIKLWSSPGPSLTRTYRGIKRQLGITSRVRVIRSRVHGRERTVEIPIYHSAGIDDVGGNIDYLVKEKHWSKNDSGIIKADDFDLEDKREKLVQHIEQNNMQKELKLLVASVWNEIEEAIAVHRESKYE